MKTFIGVIFIIILNISCLKAQKNIEFNTKTDILKDEDGKEISEGNFMKKMKDGKYSFVIKDLENGKKEVKLIPQKNTQNIEFNTKTDNLKDEDGKGISEGDFMKKMKDGKYSFFIKDLENGKKEVKLIPQKK